MICSVFERSITSLRGLYGLFKFRWASLCQYLSLTTTRIFRLWWPVHNYPLTSNQREERRQLFIQSISKSAVGALAARFNNHKECLVSDSIRHGSYNVCLFVTFPADKTRWVVRIPISPMVSDGWNKLQSEAATMQFIQRNTTIPIPKIHAYGNGECLTDDINTKQAFLIMDQLPGQPLQLDALLSSTADKLYRFYDDFGGILAQLDELQFPHTGSLYPDPKDDTASVIGPSLCLAENDLKVNTGVRRRLAPAFDSTIAAIRHQYDLLIDAFDVPTADNSQDTAMREIFAIHSIEELLPNFYDPSLNIQSFALCHGDLRFENILVDEDLRIQGILDWEWATILPQQLCTPPLWICGHDSSMRDFVRDKISEDFQRAIPPDHKYNKRLEFWREEQFSLSIAQILRHPHDLIPIYYQHIYPVLHKQPFAKTAKAFFASKDKQRSLQNCLEASERYTIHLKQQGLFIADELLDELREFLERSAKLQEELAARGI